MKNKFLIRCDADDKNGFGHFSRCLNLARGIRRHVPEAKMSFLGHFNDRAKHLIGQYNMDRVDVSSRDGEQLALAQNYDCFILDNYFIDQDYINQFINRPFKFIKIDDFNDLDLKNVDLIVNFCFRGNEFVYKAKRKCLGVKYFPVREELRTIRLSKIKTFKENIERVLVYLGASDVHDAGEKVVDVLDQLLTNTKIIFISAKIGNKARVSNRNNQIMCSSDFQNLEDILKDTDLVITGGGLIKYECAYCCIPNASLTQTPEQDEEVQAFARAGLTYYLNRAEYFDRNKQGIVDGLKDFISLPARKKLYEKAQQIFETDSTENIAAEIINL